MTILMLWQLFLVVLEKPCPKTNFEELEKK